MPDRTDDPVSSEESLLPAERVQAALRRAARLQAEATERLERAAGSPRAAPDPEDPSSGFRRSDVEAAAREAGISESYLRIALAEQDLGDGPAVELAPWVERVGSHLLRTRERTIELSRRSPAAPEAVLDAMRGVLPADPYRMTLVDSIGGPPERGGILVFQLPRVSMLDASSYTVFSCAADGIDLLHLQVTLRPVPAAGGATGTEIHFRGDLRAGTRRNVFAGLGLSGFGVGVGGAVGLLAAAVSGGVAPLLLGAGALAGALGGGGAVGAGYGAVYRYYLRRMKGELEVLLKVLDTHARTGGGFRLPGADREAPRVSGFLSPGAGF